MKKIISCIALMALLMACSKQETTPATDDAGTGMIEKAKGGNGGGGGNGLNLTTTNVLTNSAISAFLQGNLNGGGNNTQRGFCCSTVSNPTISDDTVMAGSGDGDFSKQMYGLSIGTDYYVRAFAIKQNGQVCYGNELAFTTLSLGMPGPGVGTVIDYDGNVYNTITLGTQVWMVENLKTTHYNDGSPIENITDDAAWVAATTAAYCDFGNDPANSAVYGRLYNRNAANNPNIAPAGWHVPTFSEFEHLVWYIGGLGFTYRLRESSDDGHWLAPTDATDGDNSTGFTMVGAGTRNTQNGSFNTLMRHASYYVNAGSFGAFHFRYDSDDYISQMMGCSDNYCYQYGYSIRCIKD